MSTIEQLRPSDPRGVGGPSSPSLALRVAILGSIALVMFGIIFFRLWYLQVLSGEQYVQQAQANDQRELSIPAPRGEILAREGQPIVTSQVSNAVQILPSSLPQSVKEEAAEYQAHLAEADKQYVAAGERLKAYEENLNDYESESRHGHRHADKAQLAELHVLAHADRLRSVPIPALPASANKTRELYRRLAPVIGLSPKLIDERVIAGITQLPYAPVTIKTDAGLAALTVLAERQNDFPGVKQEPVSIRSYPYRELAAQTLGHVGSVSEEELKLPAFKGVPKDTVVGQSGLEYYYDRYLRGKPGERFVQVNAEGQPEPTKLPVVEPKAGHDLKLTIDLGLQQEGEKALRDGVALAQGKGNPGSGAAFVAMNPLNGEIYAIGSYPSYDPNRFAKPMTQSEFDQLNGSGEDEGPDPRAPLLNRAVEGQYPTGSTFKPITAMGALEAGVINPEEPLGGGSCITVGAEQFCNSGKNDYGALPLVQALTVSSDTYFFTVGEYANSHGDVIQNMANELGIGKETHVDLPNEIEGTVPDAAWRAAAEQAAGTLRTQPPKDRGERLPHRLGTRPVDGRRRHAPGGGAGRTADLAAADGGRLLDACQRLHERWRRHCRASPPGPGDRQRQWRSRAESARSPDPPRPPRLLGPERRDGRHSRRHLRAGGHLGRRMGGLEPGRAPCLRQDRHRRTRRPGRTGVVHVLSADPKRPLVIAATVEQGGFGDEAAAPIARLIASKWFHRSLTLVSGSNPDK